MNEGVVFIGGVAHSGSTLLGLMLGAHPSVFYAGEAKKIWRLDDPNQPLDRRVCRLCGPDCPVWSGLRVDSGDDLYEQLSRRTNRPFVIDSSKNLKWIQHQAAALCGMVPLHLIVLVRDGRAFVNSRLRKFPEASVADQSARWVSRIRATEEFASHWPGPVHRMRYEELATWPELTLRALSAFLGIAFDPVMLDPWPSEQHPLSGNPGTHSLLARAHAKRAHGERAGMLALDDKRRDWYDAHPGGIVLDLRWKCELTPEELAVFETVAGQTNRAYAWEEPVR